MNEILMALAGLITSGGTGYLGFLFARSKYKQEVERLRIDVIQAKNTADTTAIENDIKLSNHYKEILDDLKARYHTQYKEFEDMMTRKVKLLEEENKLKDRKIKLQQQEILELKKENRLLKNAKISITRAEPA